MQTVSARCWRPLALLLCHQMGSRYPALLQMLQQVHLLQYSRQSTPEPSPGTDLLPAQHFRVHQLQAALAKAGFAR